MASAAQVKCYHVTHGFDRRARASPARERIPRAGSRGELIEITDRGRPVARLVPITDDPWQDLIHAGEVIPGVDQQSVRRRRPRTYPFSASTALERLRSDER